VASWAWSDVICSLSVVIVARGRRDRWRAWRWRERLVHGRGWAVKSHHAVGVGQIGLELGDLRLETGNRGVRGDEQLLERAAAVSMSMTRVFGASLAPSLPSAWKVIVVRPSAAMTNDAEAPSTVVAGMTCAPVALKTMRRTPSPRSRRPR